MLSYLGIALCDCRLRVVELQNELTILLDEITPQSDGLTEVLEVSKKLEEAELQCLELENEYVGQ